MRALADTLPTLRDTEGAASEPNSTEPAQHFNPKLIAKALSAQRNNTGFPRAAEVAVQEADVFELAEDHASSAKTEIDGENDDRRESATVRAVRTRLRDIKDNAARAYESKLSLDSMGGAPTAADRTVDHAPTTSSMPARSPGRAWTPRRSLATAIPFHQTDSASEQTVKAERDALAEAVEQALAEAAKEHESALSAARADAEAAATARIVEARALWVREEGQRLSAALESHMAELKIELSDTIADVLRPLVSVAARVRAVERFAALLTRLSNDSATPFVTVSGPQDLLDILAQSLSGVTTVSFQPSDAADLSVQIGDTELRTTLAQWTADIEITEATA